MLLYGLCGDFKHVVVDVVPCVGCEGRVELFLTGSWSGALKNGCW